MYTDIRYITLSIRRIIEVAKDQGPLSGFRDLLSAQTLAREQVIKTVTGVYELYGFMPIKTPAIERFETLNGKYGDEASTLVYEFNDRGNRHIALRYDHTVPLARLMVSQGKSLPSPYKRYVVGDVWRGESPQAGRYREFTQIDADIIDSDSYLADSEILAMMHDVFVTLGINVTIFVNDRQILDGLAEACSVKPEQFTKFAGIIDKIAKIGSDAVINEIRQNFGDDAARLTEEYLINSGDNGLQQVGELLNNQKATNGVSNLSKIFASLKDINLTNIKFNPTIARGLNYYTSTIFETIVDDSPSLGSVCSGGRYDELIKQLGGPDVPAVGTSIGLDRLMDAVQQLGLSDSTKTKTKVYIVNLDNSLDALRIQIANTLRANGIATEIYYKEAKLGKQLEFANKLGVNKVIIYGKDEHQKGVVVIKDLTTSDQQEVELSKLSDSTEYFS